LTEQKARLEADLARAQTEKSRFELEVSEAKKLAEDNPTFSKAPAQPENHSSLRELELEKA
jgi:hypothetical protein